jgi:multiple sugar transport system ATP-binding protein
MNLVEAFPGEGMLRFGQFTLPVSNMPRRERVVLGVRPEAFRFDGGGLPTIDARVEVVEDLGSETHLFFHVDAAPITAEVLESASDEGFLNRALFTARVEAGAPIRVGETVTLGIDVDRFHYFDAETGARLAEEPISALAGAQA